jgi:hypothetical protein
MDWFLFPKTSRTTAAIPEPVSPDSQKRLDEAGIDAATNAKFWEVFKEAFGKVPPETFESDEEEFDKVLDGIENDDVLFDDEASPIVLPRRSKGRQSPEKVERYDADVAKFCRQIIQINSTLDFKVSSRGWCYILEEHGLEKGDFDTAQRLINDCRKSGDLPLDICAEDEARLADNLEELDDDDPVEEATRAIEIIQEWHEAYNPISFWDYQEYYVQMVVEKIDLKSLFSPICKEFHIPCINSRGWSDINSRARMAERFKLWEERGKKSVLLNCGDHDIGGLNIWDFILENFRQIQRATGWNPSKLIIDRFGLNKDFIDANNLTWIENLQTSSGGDLGDPKHPDHYKPFVQNYIDQFGKRKCEANALVTRPEAGRQLCRDAILKYVNQEGIEEYEEELNYKRENLKWEIDQKLRNL